MPHKIVPPLYSIWTGMKARCLSQGSVNFHLYGARGIGICERWMSYKNFELDMMPRPSPRHSIERIDNDGNYCPENCRWATNAEQQRNRRNTVKIEIEGKTHLVMDLSRMSGIKSGTIVARAKAGLPLSEVLSPHRRYDLSGLALGGKASGAKKKASTHCKRGHEYTAENTYWMPLKGYAPCRICRACHNAKMRTLNAKRKSLSAAP